MDPTRTGVLDGRLLHTARSRRSTSRGAVVGLPSDFGKRTQLPVGVRLIGRRDGDTAIVQIALDLQEHALPARPWPDPIAPR
jgi:hypothetical protein